MILKKLQHELSEEMKNKDKAAKTEYKALLESTTISTAQLNKDLEHLRVEEHSLRQVQQFCENHVVARSAN